MSAANRWFYWQWSILGCWTPVIADSEPSNKTASGGRAPRVIGVRKLDPRHATWSLTECAEEWPHDQPEEPTRHPATSIGE